MTSKPHKGEENIFLSIADSELEVKETSQAYTLLMIESNPDGTLLPPERLFYRNFMILFKKKFFLAFHQWKKINIALILYLAFLQKLILFNGPKKLKIVLRICWWVKLLSLYFLILLRFLRLIVIPQMWALEVLSQEGQPTAFFSAKFGYRRNNYSTYDKEFYVIVKTLCILRHYLVSREFVLYSDHEAFRFLYGQQKLSARHAN